MVGAQFARDVQRRERDRVELGARNRELDRVVKQRTAMLFNLSSSLQQLTEREKAALARELHDELGGLLVAPRSMSPGCDGAAMTARKAARYAGIGCSVAWTRDSTSSGA